MKFRDIVNRDNVNLENCAQEPIHIPGSIQENGFLCAFDEAGEVIRFCSGNAAQFTGIEYKDLLGKNCAAVFPELHAWLATVELTEPANRVIRVNGRELEFTVHRSGKHIICESTGTPPPEDEQIDSFALSKQFLGFMENTYTLSELCQAIAHSTKQTTGYDRVMVYRFDKEYNGEVIAESKEPHLESFLGLHYPHTDIPPQARELYIKNQLRVITDVHYTPVPIYTPDDNGDTHLDLGLAALRSISPIHIEYLQNMGVGATLTISLLYKGALWGLIACHHYSAKPLSTKQRIAAKLQGHFITSQIDTRQLNEEYQFSKASNAAADHLLTLKVELQQDSVEQFVNNPALLRVCNANGVAILFNGKAYKAGLTPPDADIEALCNILAASTSNTTFHTTSLERDIPAVQQTFASTPGLIYHALDTFSLNCILWFRAETVFEVNWAGDPTKAIEKNKDGLSPRKSFEKWQEIVRGRSKEWTGFEIANSQKISGVAERLINAMQLAEEESKQRKLMDTLKTTNDELENINWVSSHDLQEPIRKIQLISSMILSEREKENHESMLSNVERIHASAVRMHNLMRDILRYSKLNHSGEAFGLADLEKLAKEVTAEMNESIHEKNAVVTIGKLPVINGVPFLLRQLFSNLLLNSLKFSSPGRAPHITIVPAEEQQKKEYVIEYRDNGIGFESKFNELVFNVFSRLNTTNDQPGSGIGLALCRKIMKTHKGTIHAEGTPGEGVVFRLSFPMLTPTD